MNENTGISLPSPPRFTILRIRQKKGNLNFWTGRGKEERSRVRFAFSFFANLPTWNISKKKKKNCLSKFRSRRFLIHEEFAIFALLIFYTANNSVNNFFNFNFNFDFDRGDFHFGYFFREIEKNSWFAWWWCAWYGIIISF